MTPFIFTIFNNTYDLNIYRNAVDCKTVSASNITITPTRLNTNNNNTIFLQGVFTKTPIIAGHATVSRTQLYPVQ
jgi:hypothetical protein